MLRSVVLLCVVAALVRGESTEISRCTVHSGELPINAYIEGCTTPPCPMPRDSEAIVHIVFRAPYTINRMQTYATAHMFLATIPYPLEENAETCNFLTNSYCPVLKNEILQYTLKMKIENSFPLITVTIEFRIEDDNKKSFICLRLPVAVRPAVTVLNGTLTDV